MNAIYIYAISISAFLILATVLVKREQMKWEAYPTIKKYEKTFRKIKYHYFYGIRINDHNLSRKYSELKYLFLNECKRMKPKETFYNTDFVNFIEYSNKFCPNASLTESIENFLR